jgi:hypothetical protein
MKTSSHTSRSAVRAGGRRRGSLSASRRGLAAIILAVDYRLICPTEEAEQGGGQAKQG